MAEDRSWSIPDIAQPRPEEFAFDLERALDAVVSLRADIPEDAFTASILGTERSGNGVLIGKDGLVLTIGYLITEAETVWLAANSGRVAPAHVIAYDQGTGFGLVQAHESLGVSPLTLGLSQGSPVGSMVVVAGHGGRKHSVKTRILAKQEFAGYWEYLLDEAIFTSPPHPNWGGAALVGADGKLQGIGSLYLEEMKSGSDTSGGNMIVPIDLLYPIFDDLRRIGHRSGPARPWIGMYTVEHEGHAVVAGLAKNGPAYQADIRVGDIVTEVAGQSAGSLAQLYRLMWAAGDAGVEIPLTIVRDGTPRRARVKSIDRNDLLKQPLLH